MKSIIAIAAIGALGLATQANAFMLSPPSTNFTASGPTTLTAPGFPPLNCTSTFTGNVDGSGVGHITGFQAAGGTGCSSVVATLPWTATAINKKTINFTHVKVAIPGLVSCGPGRVKGKDNAAGQVTFNATLNPGGCTVSGTVQSTPPITIVP